MKAPEKIYLTKLMLFAAPTISSSNNDVEYTKTDSFIEKATLWLLTNASDYCILHNSYDTKELVKDFVDAMKRE